MVAPLDCSFYKKRKFEDIDAWHMQQLYGNYCEAQMNIVKMALNLTLALFGRRHACANQQTYYSCVSKGGNSRKKALREPLYVAWLEANLL